MALAVQQHVVQLEVAVDDAVPVQEGERQEDLGRVEAGAALVEFARALYLEHEVAAVHELHDEVEAVAGLEGGVERGQVGVVGAEGEDAPLRQRALHVVVLDDHVLLQHLDCEVFAGGLVLRQHDLWKGRDALLSRYSDGYLGA